MRDFFDIPVMDHLLNEAASVQDYMQGFEGLDFVKENQHTTNWILRQIEWASSTLKKNSRITWYLRWLKIFIMNKQVEKPQSETDPASKDYIKFVRELKKFEEKGIPRDEVLREVSQNDILTEWEQDLAHYYTDNLQATVPKLREYEPGFKTPSVVIAELRMIEREHYEKTGMMTTGGYDESRYILVREADNHGHEKIIDLGNGWAWWLIPESSDRLEAKAMGHCGTCQNDNSVLLSLREPAMIRGEEAVVPHVTFELDDKGSLLQMKGYRNNKPESKYHPAIIKLLIEYDPIQRVKGGRYKPHTDFKLSDLNKEQQEEVEEAKPEIGENVNDLYKEWDKNGPSDEWMRMIHHSVDSSIGFVDNIREEDRTVYIEIEYDMAVDVEEFAKEYLQYKDDNDLAGIISTNDEEEYPYGPSDEFIDDNINVDTLEDNPYGSEHEDEVTPTIIEKVFMGAIDRDGGFFRKVLRYLDRKGDELEDRSRDAVLQHIIKGTSSGAANLLTLLKYASMFGLYYGNPDPGNEQIKFMAYITAGFGLGPFSTEVKDILTITSFKDFLDAKIYFVANARWFMDWLAEYAPEDWDGEESLFGYEGISSYLTDDLREYVRYDRTFEKFEWDEDEDKFLKEHYPNFNRSAIKPRVEDEKQEPLPGMELPANYPLDLDAALNYLLYKIEGKILEKMELSNYVLDMLELCR